MNRIKINQSATNRREEIIANNMHSSRSIITPYRDIALNIDEVHFDRIEAQDGDPELALAIRLECRWHNDVLAFLQSLEIFNH